MSLRDRESLTYLKSRWRWTFLSAATHIARSGSIFGPCCRSQAAADRNLRAPRSALTRIFPVVSLGTALSITPFLKTPSGSARHRARSEIAANPGLTDGNRVAVGAGPAARPDR